jgi:hypothetical protein
MKTKYTQTLRGGAATFSALLPENRRSTLPMFSHAQTIQFKKKADLFALTLIRLWTSVKLTNNQTNISEWQTSSFYTIPPLAIHQQFIEGQPKNLGALTLLNLLLSNREAPRSLGVTMSTKTAEFFFTQLNSAFWSDYFYPPYNNYFFTTEGSFEQHLTRGLSIDTHAAWWKTALQGEDGTEQRIVALEELFQFEIFETALRIFLTPTSVIERLGQLTLGQLDPNFNQYLFRTIDQFKEKFVGMLSEHQQLQWRSWIATQGLFHFKDYMRYLSQLRINSDPVLTPTLPLEIVQNLLLNGIELNIPNLYCMMSIEQIRGFTVANKARILAYFLEQFEDNWEKIANQPNDELWIFTSEFVVFLEEELIRLSSKIKIGYEIKQFACHFMMKCMSLGKHSIVNFLLSQDDTLVHVPIKKNATLLPDEEKWANHSLLYFAQQQENHEMVTLLQSKGARLLMSELPQSAINSPKSTKSNRGRRPSFWEISELHDIAKEIHPELGSPR